jgi:hypothetical protein
MGGKREKIKVNYFYGNKDWAKVLGSQKRQRLNPNTGARIQALKRSFSGEDWCFPAFSMNADFAHKIEGIYFEK